MEKENEKDYSAQGKKNRNSGRIFETKIRENLEKMGWIVDKWTNTVDYDKLKLVPAKRKFNPFKKVMTIGTGFPDFIAFKRNGENNYDVVGVEVKSNGYLSQIEKSMCMWLLENKIFSKILIAKKGAPKGVHPGGARPRDISGKMSTSGKKRGEIEYIDFREKHGKKFL
jgi:hypothetical protein